MTEPKHHSGPPLYRARRLYYRTIYDEVMFERSQRLLNSPASLVVEAEWRQRRIDGNHGPVVLTYREAERVVMSLHWNWPQFDCLCPYPLTPKGLERLTVRGRAIKVRDE